jgi:lactaldehyde reductase
MAHPLGAYYDIPHGVANALLLPIVMQYNAESSIDKYADIAKAMGVCIQGLTKEQAAQAAVDAVKALAVKVGIPEKLRDLNVKEDDLERLAQSAFNDVCTPGNPRTVTLEDALELYKKAF